MVLALGCANTIEMPPPTVLAVRPARGYNGLATSIKVSGKDFALLPEKLLDPDQTTASYPEVFLETPAPSSLGDGPSSGGYAFLGPGEMQVTVPAGLAPGKYAITVVNPGGGRHTLAEAFTVTSQPDLVVSKVTPAFGWWNGTTNVSIRGEGFASTPKVKLTREVGATHEEVALVRVAFLDSQSISAAVPPSAMDKVGAWNLVVTNPDGGLGLFAGAFTITADPPPSIAAVTPAVAGNGGPAGPPLAVTVTGANFRTGAAVRLVNDAGSELAVFDAGTLDGSTEFRTTLLSAPGEGAYLVRVRNTDQTFGDFSAFVVKPSSLKLESMSLSLRADGTTDRLTFARAGLAAVSARDDLGNTFLYAVGGDGGADPLGSVEVAQVDPFGRLSAWRLVPNPMPPRTRHGAVSLGGYVYVLGGRGPEGATDTVLRAQVLANGSAPTVTRAEAAAGGALGAWYYQVSAKMGASGANPGGETLPSDEAVVEVADGGKVVLEWTAVAGAVSYFVYRSDAANGVSGTEHRIASDVTGTSFTDTIAAAGTVRPLPPGSLGTFVEVGRLAAARAGAAVAIAHNAAGAPFLYAVGGEDRTAPRTDWESAPLASDGSALAGAFALGGGALPHTVVNATAIEIDKASAPALPAGAKSYVYVLGGTLGGGASEGVLWAEVQDDGSVTFSEVSWNTFNPINRPGMGAICANNVLTMMGGMSGAAALATSRQTQFTGMDGTTKQPIAGNASSAKAQLTSPRAFFGMTVANAFLYAVGGTTGTEVLDTTDQGIW